ncbi:FtsW/RodA/SpoVE family cell cycle protein [Priestia megaterium]
MIFSGIGEKYGLVGRSLVVVLFMVLIYEIIRVGFDRKDKYCR